MALFPVTYYLHASTEFKHDCAIYSIGLNNYNIRLTGGATKHEGDFTVQRRSVLEKLALHVQGFVYIPSLSHDKAARSHVAQRHSAFAWAGCFLQPSNIFYRLILVVISTVNSFHHVPSTCHLLATALELTLQRAGSELGREWLDTGGTSIHASAHVGERSVA